MPWPIYTEHRTKRVDLESSSKRGSDKINWCTSRRKTTAEKNIIHPALTKSKNLVLNEVHLECSAKRGINAVEAIEWVFGARLKACPWDSPSIESQQTNPYRAYFIGLNLKGDQPNS